MKSGKDNWKDWIIGGKGQFSFLSEKEKKFIWRNIEKIKIGKRLKWINRIRIGKGKGKKFGKL